MAAMAGKRKGRSRKVERGNDIVEVIIECKCKKSGKVAVGRECIKGQPLACLSPEQKLCPRWSSRRKDDRVEVRCKRVSGG